MRPIRALRSPDGRFLPNPPGWPGRPSPLVLEVTAPPRGDGGMTPLPPRGLRFRGTSSLDLFYAKGPRREAGPAPEGGHALVPSFQSPLKGPPALNYQSMSYQMFTSPRSLSLTRTCSHGDRELNRRAGSAGIELILIDTNGSSRLSRSVQSRAPGSIKRDLGEYAEGTEERAQAALDLNRKALGLLMEPIENTHQARIQAICARQRFEELLSVSLRHRERVHSRKRTENESNPHITREARDQHPPAPADGHEFLVPILVGDAAHAALPLGMGTRKRKVTGIIQHPKPRAVKNHRAG